MVHPILFYSLSILMIAGALGVVVARNPVYSVLCLVITLFGLSALFVTLGAYFVAVIQILVYAGAILVLFLFVVMLLEMAPETSHKIKTSLGLALGGGVGLIFLWQLLRVFPHFVQTVPKAGAALLTGTTREVGLLLFTTYALPFEAASILLVVGIIGAIVLAKKRLS